MEDSWNTAAVSAVLSVAGAIKRLPGQTIFINGPVLLPIKEVKSEISFQEKKIKFRFRAFFL